MSQTSFTCHYYSDVPTGIRLEQQYLLERDRQRTDEFHDQFCSEPFGYLLALREEHVVGRVRLYQREINHDGIRVLLGGIGFVATIPELRGLGVATSLLRMGMEQLASEGCEVGFLCARIQDPHRVRLYGQLGFVILGKDYAYYGRSGMRYVRNDGMIAPITSPDKFNRILRSAAPLDLGIGNW